MTMDKVRLVFCAGCGEEYEYNDNPEDDEYLYNCGECGCYSFIDKEYASGMTFDSFEQYMFFVDLLPERLKK